jgi:hypothetical protein
MNEATTAVASFLRLSAPEETGAFADVPSFFSFTTAYPVAMMAVPTPADVWHDPTVQEPGYRYLTMRTAVVHRNIRPTHRRAPEGAEELRADPDTPQALAAWARSMMGADAPDMLDI